jgi:hypothetical protein
MFNAWMNTSNVGRTTSRPFCGRDVEAIVEVRGGCEESTCQGRALTLLQETCPFEAAAQIIVRCFFVDGQLELPPRQVCSEGNLSKISKIIFDSLRLGGGDFQRVLGDIHEEANPNPPATELESSRLTRFLRYPFFLLLAFPLQYPRCIRTYCVLDGRLPFFPSSPFSRSIAPAGV